MYIFEEDNFNLLYYNLIKKTYLEGESLIKENGIELKELIPAYIKISKPKEILLLNKHRSYNPAFVIAELLWNLCGDSSNWLCQYNNLYHQYFIDDELQAGYGNRIFNTGDNQFLKAFSLLKNDPSNSHATISIFDKNYDLSNSNFVPCINFIKFRIIKNKLCMFTFMRAQDLWKGFPYDIVLLIGFFQLMSKLLDIEMGEYYHHCDSIRVFKEDYEDIEQLISDRPSSIERPNSMELFPSNFDIFNKLQYYRDLIKNTANDFSLENLKKEPIFWQNAIKTCFLYRRIQDKKYAEANEILRTINGIFYKQIFIWSKKYNKSFYNYISKLKK